MSDFEQPQAQPQAEQPAAPFQPVVGVPVTPVVAPVPELHDKPQVTRALEIKRKRELRENGEEVKLQTGNVFKIKRPNLSSLVEKGIIPSDLARSAVNAQQAKGQVSDRDYANTNKYLRTVASIAVADPVVVIDREANYEAGEIHIDDIEEVELTEIFLYVNGGMDNLKKFRSQR